MLFIILTLITAGLAGIVLDDTIPPDAVTFPRSDKYPNLSHIICKPQMYVEARKDFTIENMNYIRAKDRGPPGAYLYPKPAKCERFACEYASGIYVCNDNDHAINALFSTIADYAQAIMDDPRADCNWHEDHYKGGTDREDLVWGQAFDIHGWNVIVGMDHLTDKCP